MTLFVWKIGVSLCGSTGFTFLDKKLAKVRARPLMLTGFVLYLSVPNQLS